MRAERFKVMNMSPDEVILRFEQDVTIAEKEESVLPVELWDLIFCHVSLKDLFQCVFHDSSSSYFRTQAVCRMWNKRSWACQTKLNLLKVKSILGPKTRGAAVPLEKKRKFYEYIRRKLNRKNIFEVKTLRY